MDRPQITVSAAQTVSKYSRPVATYGLSTEGQWSLRADGAYTRPCGCAETAFYWDSVHNGTSDALENVIIDVRPDVPAQNIFSQQNVTRAWTHLKQLYPLLGAQVEEENGDPKFIVFPMDLRTVRSDEIVFRQISSDKQASNVLLESVNTRRTLSPRHPSRLYILTRTDAPQRVHVVYQVAHCISDGIAQATLKTTLLDLLSKARPLRQQLEDRLALALAMDTVWPRQLKNCPRRRWKTAIAAVMTHLRPVHGGHTIPRKMTTVTPYSTALSDKITMELPPELSSRILAGCKSTGITFGCVFPVIGQIAATRVLFRHYMRGEISEEEWEFRKREPMLTAGPLNARSMMDERWYKAGGKNHICVSLGIFTLVLPFMPLGELVNAKPSKDMENPPFSSFMSTERFWLRCQMIRKQFRSIVNHPLLSEKNYLSFRGRIQGVREIAMRWKEEQEKPVEWRDKGIEVSPMELSIAGPVITHSGSSFGATDQLYPVTFPLELGHGEKPVMRVERNEIQLHCRPAQLYLGSTFGQGKLCLFIHYDANVYERETIREYMEEVCAAANWYLASAGQGIHSISRL